MRELTARQQQILDLIARHISTTGFPPTRAEIADQLGFKSANAAEEHLKALARKGVIELTSGTSRGIRLTNGINSQRDQHDNSSEREAGLMGHNFGGSNFGGSNFGGSNFGGSNFVNSIKQAIQHTLSLPLVGRVAAGSPILAQEHIEANYAVDPALFTEQPDYLLKVRGLSMRDAGILDGDLLAVKKASEARNGQIVVARIGNDVTVKRLNKRAGYIELLPENTDFKPILVGPGDDFSLEGIGIGLIRQGRTL